MRILYLSIMCLTWLALSIQAQNTVGLISHDVNQVSEGYNLFFSHNQEKTFLIDNQGQIVKFWSDEESFRPGNSVYLLANGDLVKCKRPNNFGEDAIWAGGGGAIVEIVDWEGNVKASFELNNATERLHHDIAPMDNGNILMIAWAVKDESEAIANGRDPEIITQGRVWSEKIIEWDPVKDRIVWEWDAFDHLIQDRFSDVANYGVVNEHPEKIDINYDEHDGHPDWLHINSIDYNEELDQIVLSVPYFNELWVIDHSTTTEEAATSSGGNSGKGGDLVYRWGNPKTYQSESGVEQQLFFQHDVHWVNPKAAHGSDDYGQLLIYNNRLPNETSVGLLVQTIDPANGAYFLDEVASQNAILASYEHPSNTEITYSTGLSSVQRLSNGNVLLLAGRWGFAFELNPNGEVVWEYRIPLKGGKAAPQGSVLELNNNITFRMTRYPSNFSGFEGKDLSPQGLLEEFIDPVEEDPVLSIEKANFSADFSAYPNPVVDKLICVIPSGFVNKEMELTIVDMGTGKITTTLSLVPTSTELELSKSLLMPGINLISISNDEGFAVQKVILQN